MISKIQKQKSGGYTIIETMIAISIFAIVMTIGMGALLNANLIHQKSRDMRSIVDNLSFITEDLSRSLRTGTNYQCFRRSVDILNSSTIGPARSCSDGWALAFEAAGGNPVSNTDQWVYYIQGGKIFKSVDGATSFVQLTPDEVVIDPISGFSVLGAESPISNGDKQQPLVNIRLSGQIIYKNTSTPFSLQTSVSQRDVDI